MVDDGSTLGGLAVPLAPRANNAATITDPALDIVLGYFAAMLRTYAGAAWKSVAPGEPIVRKAFTHDPEEYDFTERDLPALYLFRTGSSKNAEDWAEDIREHVDSVRLFWIMPPANQDKERFRTPILHALGKLLDLRIQQCRDPAYVLDSDPDPTKTEQGTVVMRAAGLDWIRFLKWEEGTVAIKMRSGSEGGSRKAYRALDIKLEFEEQVVSSYDHLSKPSEATFTAAVAGAKDADGNPLPDVPFSEFRSS